MTTSHDVDITPLDKSNFLHAIFTAGLAPTGGKSFYGWFSSNRRRFEDKTDSQNKIEAVKIDAELFDKTIVSLY